jgi:hypothetical protein
MRPNRVPSEIWTNGWRRSSIFGCGYDGSLTKKLAIKPASRVGQSPTFLHPYEHSNFPPGAKVESASRRAFSLNSPAFAPQSRGYGRGRQPSCLRRATPKVFASRRAWQATLPPLPEFTRHSPATPKPSEGGSLVTRHCLRAAHQRGKPLRPRQSHPARRACADHENARPG